MIKDKFMIRIQKQNENIKKYSSISNSISIARFMVFIGIILLTYIIIKINHKSIYVIIDFILSIILVVDFPSSNVRISTLPPLASTISFPTTSVIL